MADLSQALFPMTACHAQALGTGSRLLCVGRRAWNTPGSVGKPAPLFRSPAQRFGCQPKLPLLQWVWEAAGETRPVGAQKLSKLGEGWLLLEFLALTLFLVISCADVCLSEWEILVYVLFLSHLENLTGMRFWAFHQFECFILQHALKIREENIHNYCHFASVQLCWGFGAKAGAIHFTVNCWCAKIPQKDYLHGWKQEGAGTSGARFFSWPFWGSSTDSKVRSSHTVQVFIECFIGVKLHTTCHLFTVRSL